MASVSGLARDTIIYGISHIFPRLINFIFVTSYLTYNFGKEEYGRYVEIYAYITVILAVVTFRMDTAYFRYANNAKGSERDKIYSTLLVPIVILTTFAFIFIAFNTDLIVRITQIRDGHKIIMWMTTVMALDAFTTNIYSKYRLDHRPIKFMALKIINVLLIVGLMVFFTKVMHVVFPIFGKWMDKILQIKSGIEYAYFANLVASIVVFLLVLPDIMKIKFSLDTALLKKALNYSWPLTIIALAASFNSYFTTPLVKFLSGGGAAGEAEAGVFSAGLKLSLLVNLFSTAYNYAAEPFFFKQSNQSKDKSIFGRAALAFTIFACFVVLAIYSFIDVLQFLLGSEVRGGIVVMPLLLMANVFIGLYYNVSMWYKLSDNTKTGLLISLMGMAITYGVCYLLIPKIGILGAAWATFLCYLTMLVTSYFQGQKYYPLVYPVKKILAYLLVTSFLLLVLWVMREKMNLEKMYSITINIIVFGTFTIIVYTLEIKRFIPEIKNKVLSKLKT